MPWSDLIVIFKSSPLFLAVFVGLKDARKTALWDLMGRQMHPAFSPSCPLKSLASSWMLGSLSPAYDPHGSAKPFRGGDKSSLKVNRYTVYPISSTIVGYFYSLCGYPMIPWISSNFMGFCLGLAKLLRMAFANRTERFAAPTSAECALKHVTTMACMGGLAWMQQV